MKSILTITSLFFLTSAIASPLKCTGRVSKLSKFEKVKCMKLLAKRINDRVDSYKGQRHLYEPGLDSVLKNLQKSDQQLSYLGMEPVAWQAPKKECKTVYGKTVCGFNCVASYGDIKCSKTPSGSCLASYGSITCGDPSFKTKEKMSCEAAYGKIACGYNCVSSYGEIKCSQTPNGNCLAAFGEIKCAEAKNPMAPKVQCETSFGEIICK